MSLTIKTFHETDLSSVVSLYNELVASIPCNWPVTRAEFADEVMGKGKLSRPDFPFDPRTMLIASVAGTDVGFVDFAVLKESKDGGLLRFLTFPEGQSEVGEALGHTAVEHLQRSGCTLIEAWQMQNGDPFFASKHGGCWEQSHVTNLLLANGFAAYHREVVFHRAPKFGFEAPRPTVGKRIEKSEERFGHDILCHYAIREGAVEAARTSWYRMSVLSRHPSALDHGYIYEVETTDKYRRLRLGRILMQEMISDMHLAGVHEATLHSMFDNVPAIGLYTKTAFQYIETSVILRKTVG